MADNFTLNITETFDLDDFTDQITAQYQAKGFQVLPVKTKKSVKLVFKKGCGGLNMLFGLGRGISATCTIMGKDADMISVNFSEGDWTGKIIGCTVGLFCCLGIPTITSIVGIVKQLNFSKDLSNDMQMMLAEMD